MKFKGIQQLKNEVLSSNLFINQLKLINAMKIFHIDKVEGIRQPCNSFSKAWCRNLYEQDLIKACFDYL